MGSAANITSRPRGKLEKRRTQELQEFRSCKLKEFRSQELQESRMCGAGERSRSGALELKRWGSEIVGLQNMCTVGLHFAIERRNEPRCTTFFWEELQEFECCRMNPRPVAKRVCRLRRTSSQKPSSTPTLHHSNAPVLHHSNTPILHHSGASSLHPFIVRLPHILNSCNS